MVIQIDSREKPKAISSILNEFNRQGIKHFVSKLPVGDYQSLDNARLVIDRKQSLHELCSNLCQQHERFKAELEKAKELGITLVILCEHGGTIKAFNDILDWVNPRLKVSPKAMTGKGLHSALHTIGWRYGVRYEFCKKSETGKRIVEILSEGVTL